MKPNKGPRGMEEFLKKKDDPTLEKLRRELMDDASKNGPSAD
jgi:hypothetical protein